MEPTFYYQEEDGTRFIFSPPEDKEIPKDQ